MTRTSRLALATSAFAGAATALAALLWLAPAGSDPAPRPAADPEITGSVVRPSPAEEDAAEIATAPAEAQAEIVAEPRPDAAPAGPAPFVATRDADGLRLAGAVPDEAERAAILIAARARFVAEPVFAELVVDPAAEPAPPEVAAVALSALARLAEGEARLSGNVLAIDGRALWAQARQRIEDDLRVRLPESWRAELAVETPQPTPEPMIAPIPARADPAPEPAADETRQQAAARAGDPASAPAAYAVLPPSAREGELAALARHPLPPRR
ncbi:hypothetical protein [Salinarimonas rosea]|uniref:hypothetical protein n=1 Tax=Salinarimonas rosea TaxID=552063 RepID=UPI00048B59EB|nr:hypothetical protein [Salinarimonas rosea]